MDEIVLAARSSVKKVVFLFHGYGADKNDLRPVGEQFSKVLPEAEIHLPNGIEKCDEGMGRQWFALDGEDVNLWKQAFVENFPKISSYVDTVIKERNLTYGDVVFSGFSQGAMLALSLGLKFKAKAVVAFSGLLLDSQVSVDCRDTKILLTHGEKDNVIPIEAMKLTEEALNGCGISVETAVNPNLAHGIDDYLLNRAIDFLKRL
jgi:phospholipase/carboxylesterase